MHNRWDEVLVQQYIDPYYWESAWTEDISDLLSDIAANGIKQPLEILIDAEGMARLFQGSHRLRCAVILGYETVPIVMKHSPRAFDRGWHRSFLPAAMINYLEEWLVLLNQTS